MTKDDEISEEAQSIADMVAEWYGDSAPRDSHIPARLIAKRLARFADRARRAPGAAVIKDDEIPTDVQRLAAFRADWLVDAVACSTQNRAFLRGEEEEDVIATDSIYRDGKKAVEMAIMTDRAERSSDAAVPFAWATYQHGEFQSCDRYEISDGDRRAGFSQQPLYLATPPSQDLREAAAAVLQMQDGLPMMGNEAVARTERLRAALSRLGGSNDEA